MEIKDNVICNERVNIGASYDPQTRTLKCTSPIGDYIYYNKTTYKEIFKAIVEFASDCFYYERD